MYICARQCSDLSLSFPMHRTKTNDASCGELAKTAMEVLKVYVQVMLYKGFNSYFYKNKVQIYLIYKVHFVSPKTV